MTLHASNGKSGIFVEQITGVVATISIADAGTGYSAEDVITLTGGNGDATVTVSTVDGEGAITGVSVTDAGTGYVPGTYDATGGGGEGAQITVATIGSGAATVEFNLGEYSHPNHVLTAKVLTSAGAETTPTGGTAAVWVKMYESDGYQPLQDEFGNVSINLQTGPWSCAWSIPVAGIKVVGATLGGNASMVAMWNSWK